VKPGQPRRRLSLALPDWPFSAFLLQPALIRNPLARCKGHPNWRGHQGAADALQAEVAEDTSSQYHVRNLMMRLSRQYLAGHSDLRRWDAQLLQKYSQGVKPFWLAQLNRSDPIFVTAEAD
jgi:hypothetical protein